MAKITKEVAAQAKLSAMDAHTSAEGITKTATTLGDVHTALLYAQLATISINVACIMQHLAEEE